MNDYFGAVNQFVAGKEGVFNRHFDENLQRYVEEHPGRYVLWRNFPFDHESFHMTKWGVRKEMRKMNGCFCCNPPFYKKIPKKLD